MREPPGLLLDLQGLRGEVLLGDGPVDPPQQLLGLALVHRGDELIAANAHYLHYVSRLQAYGIPSQSSLNGMHTQYEG